MLWFGLAVALFALGGPGLQAQAAKQVFTGPTVPLGESIGPGMNWYGVSATVLGVSMKDPGTHPFYAPTIWPGSSDLIPSPTLYPLTSDAYNNAFEYGRAMVVANGIRMANVLNQKATDTKESVDPLLGKTTGLSFWQWVKVGQYALQTYAKAAAIVRALHSGTVNINIWKLIPKVNVIDENSPGAPLIQLGLVPSDQGVIAMAKSVTMVNDPRFYGGNLVNFDEITNLVPSLAVTPSFYGAIAHMDQTSPADQQQKLLLAAVTKNFHEMRVGLSMIARGVMGTSETEADIKRSRFSTAYAAQLGDQMKASSTAYYADLASELKRGATLMSPDLGVQASQLAGRLNQVASSEGNTIDNLVQVKAANTWQAKRIAGDMDNVTVPLETDAYMKMAKNVDDLIRQYASTDATPGVSDDKKMQLGLAVADAWTNKLIFDEMRAIRQIYAARVEQEGIEKLAPIIGQSQDELEMAKRKLKQLQMLVADMSGGDPTAHTFFTGDDVARVATKMALPAGTY